METFDVSEILQPLINNGTIVQFSYSWYDWTSILVSAGIAVFISFIVLRYFTWKRSFWKEHVGASITLLVTFSVLFYMLLLLTVDVAAVCYFLFLFLYVLLLIPAS